MGTTRATAGSKQAFRHVDYELPLAFGQAAHAAGVETFAIVTAMAASANSFIFYSRTKGEVERMKRDAEQHAEEDERRREFAEAKNAVRNPLLQSEMI